MVFCKKNRTNTFDQLTPRLGKVVHLSLAQHGSSASQQSKQGQVIAQVRSFATQIPGPTRLEPGPPEAIQPYNACEVQQAHSTFGNSLKMPITLNI